MPEAARRRRRRWSRLAPENQGTRNQFLADVTPYSAGSDHDDYDSSTIAVPSLYLRDWPDIYIHTDHDTLQQIDPTKLRRVALLGAASGYVYATLDGERSQALLPFYTAQSEIRLAQLFQLAQQFVEDPKLDPGAAWYEARNLMQQGLRRELATLSSLLEFAGSNARHPALEKALTDQAATFNEWIDSQANARGAQGRGAESALGGEQQRRRKFPSGSATSDRLPTRTTTFSRRGLRRSAWRKSSC